MTPAALAAIEARHRGATIDALKPIPLEEIARNMKAFIDHAETDVAALLAHIRSLEAEREAEIAAAVAAERERAEKEQGALKDLAVAGAQSAANSEARARAAEAENVRLREALKMIRFNWAGHAEQCRGATEGFSKCDCDWPKIAKQCDAALAHTPPAAAIREPKPAPPPDVAR